MSDVKIVCFAEERWNEIGKRVQHLMRCLAESNDVASVLYVNPPVSCSILDIAKGKFVRRQCDQNRLLRLRALLGSSVDRVADKLWVYTGSWKTLPLTRFAAVRRLDVLNRLNLAIYCALIRRFVGCLSGEHLVVWLSYPLQAFAIDAFPDRALLIYDWMDDWEEFEILPVQSRRDLADVNERVVRRADLVLAVSTSLWRRARKMNQSAFLVPNATDYDLFAAARNLPIAPEMAAIPSPRIGYFGRIGDRVDFSLLRYVADERPRWSVVLIGPVWENRMEAAQELEAYPNVYFLGPRPYRDLPGLVAGFDVCLIPHTCDALTASMDPIKLYDYLATGASIVSTPVAGVERFADVVYVGNTPERFLTALDQAVAEKGRLREQRLDYARQNTWPRRAEEVWALIHERLAETPYRTEYRTV